MCGYTHNQFVVYNDFYEFDGKERKYYGYSGTNPKYIGSVSWTSTPRRSGLIRSGCACKCKKSIGIKNGGVLLIIMKGS